MSFSEISSAVPTCWWHKWNMRPKIRYRLRLEFHVKHLTTKVYLGQIAVFMVTKMDKNKIIIFLHLHRFFIFFQTLLRICAVISLFILFEKVPLTQNFSFLIWDTKEKEKKRLNYEIETLILNGLYPRYAVTRLVTARILSHHSIIINQDYSLAILQEAHSWVFLKYMLNLLSHDRDDTESK